MHLMDVKNGNAIPIILAAENGRIDIIELLLSKGASLHDKSFG